MFFNVQDDERTMNPGQISGDFRGSVVAVQLTNRSEFLGYSLILQTGVRIDRRSLEVIDQSRDTETAGLTFLSVFAGLD